VGYGPAVALTGNTRVGVAWSACHPLRLLGRLDQGRQPALARVVRQRRELEVDGDAGDVLRLELEALQRLSVGRHDHDASALRPLQHGQSSFSTYKTILEVGSGTP
jgi:hypothetical protein